jgi:hypothetical protein
MRYDEELKIRFRNALRGAFPDPEDLDLVITDAGRDFKQKWVDLLRMRRSTGNALDVLIDWAEAHQCLLRLVKAAVDRNPSHPDLSQVAEEFRRLLDPLRELDAEAGQFERVLFKQKPFEDIGPWLDKLAAIRRAICRVEPQPIGESLDGYGTGFLIAPDLVITAWHVAKTFWGSDLRAERVVLRFGCENDSAGNEKRGEEIRLQPDWSLPKNGREDRDYALLRLERSAVEDPSGHKRPFLTFTDKVLERSEPILILQHPGAGPLKLALGSIESIEGGRYLWYKVNTRGGSSGGPCLAQNLDLVGMHHYGTDQRNRGVAAGTFLPEIKKYLPLTVSPAVDSAGRPQSQLRAAEESATAQGDRGSSAELASPGGAERERREVAPPEHEGIPATGPEVDPDETQSASPDCDSLAAVEPTYGALNASEARRQIHPAPAGTTKPRRAGKRYLLVLAAVSLIGIPIVCSSILSRPRTSISVPQKGSAGQAIKSPARDTEVTPPKAFAVVDGSGSEQRSFEFLWDAIGDVADGQFVEVRGNGPFPVPTLVGDAKSISIRAGKGFRPRFILRDPDPKPAWIQVTNGSLSISGCDFEVPANTHLECLFRVDGEQCQISRCRFRASGRPFLVLNNTHRLELVGCLVLNSGTLVQAGPSGTAEKPAQITLNGNVICASNGIELRDEWSTASINLNNNILICGTIVELPRVYHQGVVEVTGGGNVLAPSLWLLFSNQSGISIKIDNQFIWSCERNLHVGKNAFSVNLDDRSNMGRDVWKESWNRKPDSSLGVDEVTFRWEQTAARTKADVKLLAALRDQIAVKENQPELGPKFESVGPQSSVQGTKRLLPLESGPIILLARESLVPGQSKPTGYQSISSAFKHAEDGDTIEIRTNREIPGGKVWLGKQVTLRAGDGYTPTITGGLRLEPLVGTELKLEGIRFRGDYVEVSTGNRSESAITQVSHCTFEENTHLVLGGGPPGKGRPRSAFVFSDSIVRGHLYLAGEDHQVFNVVNSIVDVIHPSSAISSSLILNNSLIGHDAATCVFDASGKIENCSVGSNNCIFIASGHALGSAAGTPVRPFKSLRGSVNVLRLGDLAWWPSVGHGMHDWHFGDLDLQGGGFIETDSLLFDPLQWEIMAVSPTAEPGTQPIKLQDYGPKLDTISSPGE